MTTTIEAATDLDLPAIKKLAVDTGLFEAGEVDMFDEMFSAYLDGSMEDHQWVVLRDERREVVGAAYVAPEPFSDRLWNLYFLAVSPTHQGRGGGSTLIGAVESQLRDLGEDRARVLLVETSGLPTFEATRAFYRDSGFDEEARIRQFYGPADDKILFWKALTP